MKKLVLLQQVTQKDSGNHQQSNEQTNKKKCHAFHSNTHTSAKAYRFTFMIYTPFKSKLESAATDAYSYIHVYMYVRIHKN